MEKKSIENKQTEIHAFVRLFVQLKVQKIPIFFLVLFRSSNFCYFYYFPSLRYTPLQKIKWNFSGLLSTCKTQCKK